MSQVVQSDAQFTMARPIRPFANFEKIYQGKDGTLPIAFPGDLDAFAAKQVVGYDPNLLAGFTVPLGSRVTIWIPQTISGYTVNANYAYQVMWRLRNVGDFRQGQLLGISTENQSYSSYHLPATVLGQPEVVTVNPDATFDRVFIPGATRIVAYEQTEPGTPGAATQVNLRGERIYPDIDPTWVQPLTPQGNLAVWQQGTYVGSSHANTGGPSWVPFTFDAEGDEMSVLAYKIDPTNPWDFTTDGATGDLAFSNTFGNNNGQNAPSKTSILVFTGTP